MHDHACSVSAVDSKGDRHSVNGLWSETAGPTEYGPQGSDIKWFIASGETRKALDGGNKANMAEC